MCIYCHIIFIAALISGTWKVRTLKTVVAFTARKLKLSLKPIKSYLILLNKIAEIKFSTAPRVNAYFLSCSHEPQKPLHPGGEEVTPNFRGCSSEIKM